MSTNKHLSTVAAVTFIAGACVLVWVGVGFANTSPLALLMTMLIGAVYVFGAFELHRFRQTTAALDAALANIPEHLNDLGDWLAKVPASLQTPVRLRIEGDRASLPGPALTPYLVGLLVMLGMLGTFLGMVVTLKGAVFALEKTADLQAIRSALSVPVAGLGLAFGTSVAGVAASATLGLMSALARRERLQTAQVLDTRVATTLRRFSLHHQRQETFRALQQQSAALPAVVDKLQVMMTQMENMSSQLNQRLLGNQEAFHGHIQGVYTELAKSVDKSLHDSLSRTAQAAGESIKPVVEAAMSGVAHETLLMQQRAANTVQQHLDTVAARFADTTATVAHTWTAALASQEQTNANLVAGVSQALDTFNTSFERRSSALVTTVSDTYANLQTAHAERDQARQQTWTQSLEAITAALAQQWQQANAQTLSRQQDICDTLTKTVQDVTAQSQAAANRTLDDATRLIAGAEDLMRTRIASEAQWLEQHRERMDQLAGMLRTELGALSGAEATRALAAAERLAQMHEALQAALTGHLTTLGTALEEPITRLIHTASEAPRAAAEVIAQLRQEISNSLARDNALLEERGRIMATLNALLEAINHASTEQRAVIDSLVASSAAALDATAGKFADNVAAETAKLTDMSASVTGSAVDVASLSEALGVAVQSFSEANEKLIANLQRIEGAMDKSMARSDEQLAYYVAQAREIIDLSLTSQQEMVEQLRQMPAKRLQMDEAR